MHVPMYFSSNTEMSLTIIVQYHILALDMAMDIKFYSDFELTNLCVNIVNMGEKIYAKMGRHSIIYFMSYHIISHWSQTL